jgi:hypothetical protein
MVLLLSLCLLAPCPGALAIELEVTGLDGRAVRGRLIQLAPEIILDTATGETALTWPEVLALRPLDLEAFASSAVAGGPLRFELADGSSFSGRIDSASEQSFTVRLQTDQTCRLDLSLLRTVCSTSASSAARAKLLANAPGERRSEDVAVVEREASVIVLRGAVRNIGLRQVRFAWKERELSLPWERLAGLSFARPLPRSSSCTVCLHGDEVFSGRVIAGDQATITLQSGVFDHLVLPWSRVDRIECRSPRLTYLSDLAPLRYEFTPFFQKHWEYACDRTLTARPIRLAGRLYAKGVTMHSRASLAYELGGEYRQFAALVGIVDEMADRGDVTVAVLGDGRVLWQAANIRGGQEPQEVLVDVTGVREFSLHVDFGDGLDLSDHVCWALARLIR